MTAITNEETNLEEEDASEEKSNSSTSVDDSDIEEKIKSDIESTENEAINFSNETRERFCLKAEPTQSSDITLHPVLAAEWGKWMRKSLYEGDKEKNKKREEEESNQLREKIMKKFPRKEALHAEAPKLNPEILAYMSGTAKSRDKHFVSSQNALDSVMVAVAKSISLILELEKSDILNTLIHFLGNADKLLAGSHYQQSVRRTCILPG